MRIITMFFLLVILYVACVDNTPDVPGEGDNFFEYTANGEKFRAEDLFAYAVTDGNEFTIYGTGDVINDTDATLTYIIVEEDKGTVTYNLSEGAEAIGYHVNQDGSFSYYTIPQGTDGELTITSKTSERIKGTFNFKAIDPTTEEQISITNGSFDVAIRQ